MSSSFSDLIRSLRLKRGGAERAPGPDPFETLAIQLRLGSVAAEIRSLEQDSQRWARGFHLVAATAAYDGLLCDAARMSGLPIPDTEIPVRKLILESELRQLGWTW